MVLGEGDNLSPHLSSSMSIRSLNTRKKNPFIPIAPFLNRDKPSKSPPPHPRNLRAPENEVEKMKRRAQ